MFVILVTSPSSGISTKMTDTFAGIHFNLLRKRYKMKNITLALLVASALFGQSEEFYKAKYTYLVEKHGIEVHECLESTFKATTIHTRFDYYTRADQERDTNEMRDNCVKNETTKEKIMDLKFNVIEDLKAKPEWFTFGDKK